MAISEPWVRTNGQLQSLHNFQQKFRSNCSFCLKFCGPLTNWKFEPSSKAHIHSDPIINKHTEQVKNLHMDLSWHALNSKLQAKTTLYHTEKQGFGYPWLSKKFQTHPPKPTEVKPLRKVSLPLAKLRMLFPAHPWVREFWPQIYSLWQALDWGALSKILASMKMGGA